MRNRIHTLAFKPDPDPTPDPPPDPTPDPAQTVTREELTTIIGETLDNRLAALKLDEKFSKLDVLDGIEDKITGLFETHKSGNLDKDSLLKDVGGLLDRKLQGIGSGNVGRRIGPLGRWLAGSTE